MSSVPCPYVDKDLENAYVFKVKDYSTHLVGFLNDVNKCFYVIRGDGMRYEYDKDRVEWFQPLIIDPFYQNKL
jgi:hypothetical protein